MKTLHNLSPSQQNVLLRVDWNVPTDKQIIQDSSRITSSLQTIQRLLTHGHRITLISHRGRPQSNSDQHLSFQHLMDQISHLCNHTIQFVSGVEYLGAHWNTSPLSLFENVRFYHEESLNDPIFAKKLSSGAHAYVNDAFSVSHRPHASVEAITHYLPCYVGNLLEKELNTLDSFVTSPTPPLVAICGGAKISSKIGFIEHMLDKASTIALAGGIANTFWAAKGVDVGPSLVDTDSLPIAKQIIKTADHKSCSLWLPNYVRVANNLDDTPAVKHITEIEPTDIIFDMAEKSYTCLLDTCSKAKSVIWNGALGVFEHPSWGEGTFKLAQGLAKHTQENQLLTLAGGGETIMALSRSNTLDKLSYVSMAGGAFMEYISGISLPGIEALKRKWRTQEESNP